MNATMSAGPTTAAARPASMSLRLRIDRFAELLDPNLELARFLPWPQANPV